MRTVIFTRKDKTTLTIVTSEDLYLEQMGREDRIRLVRGTNTVLAGAGVFRILSRAKVSVTADDAAACEVVATLNNKDGGALDPLDMKENPDREAALFFLDAKSEPAPR